MDNFDDIIDSRDVIKRIEELRDDLASRQEDRDACQYRKQATAGGKNCECDACMAFAEWNDGNEGLELAALERLQEDAEGYSDWLHGVTLIRDSHFTEYAQDLADDIYGNAMRNVSWPFDYIDWERAADALKQDYTAVDFDGVEYWVRS